MKKQTLILAAGLTLASLLLSGCGNDSKFTTANENFLKYYEEMNNYGKNVPLWAHSSCSEVHSIYKKEYEAMIKADKELKIITELAKKNPEFKKKLRENWREIKEFDAIKYDILQYGKGHIKARKCNLEGLNLDIE